MNAAELMLAILVVFCVVALLAYEVIGRASKRNHEHQLEMIRRARQIEREAGDSTNTGETAP